MCLNTEHKILAIINMVFISYIHASLVMHLEASKIKKMHSSKSMKYHHWASLFLSLSPHWRIYFF